MATPSKLASDAVDELASPRSNFTFELPANPFEEDEKQATNPPTTTVSKFSLLDSHATSSSAVDLKPVQEVEISAEKRNDFLKHFFELADIKGISVDFDEEFTKHIVGLNTSDYVKFVQNPIAKCLAFVNNFYGEFIPTLKNAYRVQAKEDQDAFIFSLKKVSEKNKQKINDLAADSTAPTTTASSQALQDSRTPSSSTVDVKAVSKNLEAINKLAASNLAPISAASTSTSTASTQPPKGSSAPSVVSVGVNPVAKEIESEKTESSSEPEIVTESSSDVDTDADDAASESEKTEES